MLRALALLLLLAGSSLGAADSAASITSEIQQLSLDPNNCYRVRDLTLIREDLKIYLTDGYLIFGKPVRGRVVTAVFSAEVDGGDAEILLLPPTRSERLSLASFAKTPNLNEHFRAAVFVFTDNAGNELLEAARDSRKVPEIVSMLSPDWESVARNLALSFGVRLVEDLLSPVAKDEGFFFGAFSGKTLGSFDVLYQPRGREQIVAGQVATRDNRIYFDVWTSFRARSWRMGRRQPLESPATTKDFRITVDLDDKLYVKAVTRMKVTPTRDIGRAIAFDLSRRMKVTAARIDGQPAEIFSRDSLRANLLRSADNELFLLIKNEPFEKGREYELEFEHEGNVVAAAGNGVYYVGARGDWYPTRGSDFATYDLTFRYPKNLTLVATGNLVDERTEGDFNVAHRRTAVPIRFAGFNLGDYEKATSTRAGVKVEVYANRKLEAALQPRRPDVVMPPPPMRPSRGRAPEVPLAIPTAPVIPDPLARLRELASETSSAVEYFSTLLGPQPLAQLTVAPIPGAFGQGFPGLIYLSTLSYLRPDERPAAFRASQLRMFYSEILHAHEVAHQWWGNLVCSASQQDDWMMESLANYSALLYLEKKKGRKALEGVLDEYRENLLNKDGDDRTVESAGPIVWGTRLTTSQTPNAWRIITYEKGTWIMHMLRSRLGDQRFFSLMAEVAKRFRYKSLNMEQFQAVAAEFAPKDVPDAKLDEFFDQWVRGTGIPALKLSYTISGKAPRLTAKATITQADVDEEFSALVPVHIMAAGKRIGVKWVETSSTPVQFTIPLKQAAKLTLDQNITLMR